MSERKEKAVRRILSSPDEKGKRWYQSYVETNVASGKEPLGLKKIKKMARGIPIKVVESDKFLDMIEDETWNK